VTRESNPGLLWAARLVVIAVAAVGAVVPAQVAASALAAADICGSLSAQGCHKLVTYNIANHEYSHYKFPCDGRTTAKKCTAATKWKTRWNAKVKVRIKKAKGSIVALNEVHTKQRTLVEATMASKSMGTYVRVGASVPSGSTSATRLYYKKSLYDPKVVKQGVIVEYPGLVKKKRFDEMKGTSASNKAFPYALLKEKGAKRTKAQNYVMVGAVHPQCLGSKCLNSSKPEAVRIRYIGLLVAGFAKKVVAKACKPGHSKCKTDTRFAVPTVIMGDLNAMYGDASSNSAPRRLESLDFVDTRECHQERKNTGPIGSWVCRDEYTRNVENNRDSIYDYIFYKWSRAVGERDFKTWADARYSSDHRMISVYLKFKATR
jgi:hypothetical protein